jgi:phospho-N-acetylmuramoyl-pentapeptide-transferase
MTNLILPIIVSFATALIIGPILIPLMQKLKFGQVVRDDGPESHLSKTGTPTMGGFIIIISVLVSVFIFIKGFDPYIIAFTIAFIGFGLIGFIDDYIKVVLKRSMGLRAWQKSSLQLIVSIILAIFIYNHIGTQIRVPFYDKMWDIGWWIIPFAVFVLMATTNSSNLTDGLDGLVAGISLVYFATYALIFSFGIIYSGGNLMVICAAMVGACLGFIRFNTYPARIFMGDLGSLAIGGAVGMIALLSKTALWVPIMGFMFMISSISVIIQVGSYKTRKKRVFKMAPIHHHFEKLGYPEMKITTMYIIITTILCLIGILAFK